MIEYMQSRWKRGWIFRNEKGMDKRKMMIRELFSCVFAAMCVMFYAMIMRIYFIILVAENTNKMPLKF
jgi:hypothetical protein